VLIGVPTTRRRAFKAGWFERAGETRRTRAQRRPSHGGLVLAVALALGALAAGPSQPVTQATVLACLIAVATGFRAERARGSVWVVRLGRLAAAAAVPAVGIRAGLTGGVVADAVVTALIALALIRGVRSIDRSDAVAPLVAAVGAAGLLLVAVRGDDVVAPVAAALVGVGGAMAANTWPPALARIGTIGPTALGAALAAVAIELSPDVAAPRSALVPLFCVVVLAAAAVVPQWDRRLRARRIEPRLALPLAAVAGVVAADGLVRGAIELPLAAAIALVPTAVLALIGLSAPPRRTEDSVSRRGRTVAIGAGAVVVLGSVAALAGILLIDARRSMEQGREFATAGLDAARDGDLEEAQRLFATADVAFADASDALDNPAVRVGEVVPGLGPNLRNARALASVGGDLSSTAVAVAERAGADDLLVVDGRFPVEGARAVSADLGTALDTLRASSARLDDAASPYLLDEVRRGSDEVGERITDATNSIEVAAEATRLVPALLGAEGERRWMVALLTPSEQRGAGGFAGDYAEVRAADGVVDLVRTIPASEMNGATDPEVQLAVLPAVYRDHYGGYRPGRFWQNLSATPDVPTFAEAIAAAFPLTRGGGPVDGVVTIDPYGVAALLELTGPVTVSGWPEPLTAENAARVLLFEQYDRLSLEQEVDQFQSDVIEAVTDALTTGTLPPPSVLAATLGPAVAGGHLRLWSPEADAQALFERIGADGTLEAPADGSDFVQVLTQNASESKIDWYLRRAYTYEPTVDPATGAIEATVTVTLTNTAPTTGVSAYVLGEENGPTKVGENEVRLTVLSPHRLSAATGADGEELPVNIAREKGLYAVTVSMELDSGASQTVELTFAGLLSPTDGDYRLHVRRQPAVVPDEVDVTVHGAPGWEPATQVIDPATLEGDRDATVNVRFERAG
jgi:UDP-N-acetylmuramyl pentapeptide phosphotransferase/UDP-N-acetylglucosamine-1-phosphate transferase